MPSSITNFPNLFELITKLGVLRRNLHTRGSADSHDAPLLSPLSPVSSVTSLPSLACLLFLLSSLSSLLSPVPPGVHVLISDQRES